MRIKIRNKEGLPEVYEAKSARPVTDKEHKLFHIEFYLGQEDGKRRFIIASTALNEDGSAPLPFNAVMTSAGLNGYANLCKGEQASLITEEWDVQFIEERA